MEKIALFGGTGRTGRLFLAKAVEAGHQIRLLARSPEKVTVRGDQVEVIQGDVLHPDDVAKAIAGSTQVVSLFGHVKGSPAGLQTQGTQNIVQAMQDHQVSRIISLSGGGLPFEHDAPKFADKAIRFIMSIFAKKILDDAIQHAEVLKKSDLDWTIVRGPRLTDGAEKGAYRVSWIDQKSGTAISRADLANFLIKLVEEPAYHQEMPFVAYP